MTKEIAAYVGIDVSKKTLDVTLLNEKGGKRRKRIANTTAGIHMLLEWLKRQTKVQVHVCMESTSVYWEEVAETLYEAGYKVSVVNPVRIKGHAMSKLYRSKTDAVDADVTADFCKTQAPAAWEPPSDVEKKLRALVRHLEALKKSRIQQSNRLSTCKDEDVKNSLDTLLNTIDAEIKQVQKRIDDLIDQNPDLKEKKELLKSIPGFSDKTAIHILAEMYDLPAYENAKAVAADAGITTSHHESGTTVYRRPKISRMGKAALRAALFYPAITAIQHNPAVKQLAKRLEARGKKKSVIRVAAMRKLMHLAYGVIKNKQPFDPAYTG
jgi:transposase